MAHRGMKKLRKIEKAGLIVLCVVMLVTLGIGTGSMFGEGADDSPVGTFKVGGEEVVVSRVEGAEYQTFLSFQNYVLGGAPIWKFNPNLREYQADEKDLWTFIMLDHTARKAGVTVPSSTVTEWIRLFFQDRATGVYDRALYDRFMANSARVWPTPMAFERLVSRYLSVLYLVSLYQPLIDPSMESIYNTWKHRNKRQDAKYIVQDLAPLRENIDLSSFTTDEVRAFYDQDRIKRNFRVPTKREFEAVYVSPLKLTSDEYAAIAKRSEDEGMVQVGPTEAFQYYYSNQDKYPIAPIQERLEEEWKAEQEKKKEEEGNGEDGDTDEDDTDEGDTDEGDTDEGDTDEGDTDEGDTDEGDIDEGDTDEGDTDEGDTDEGDTDEGDIDEGDTDEGDADEGDADENDTEEPVWVDPTIDMSPQEKYDAYFKEQVERELLLNRLMTRLLGDERIHMKGIEAVAADWGLQFYRTEGPIDQQEVRDIEEIGGIDLQMELNGFGPGTGGTYSKKTLGIENGEDRRILFFLVKEVVAEHDPELTDDAPASMVRNAVWNPSVSYTELENISVREILEKVFPDAQIPEQDAFTVEDVARFMLRQARGDDRAKELLDTVRDLVSGGNQSLEGAAAEKGYTVKTLAGVTKETVVPANYEAAEGEELTPEQEKANRQRDERRFLLKGRVPGNLGNLERIDQTEAESFVADVLTDLRTDAGYLVYVTAHRIPGPEEMPEVEASMLKFELRFGQEMGRMAAFFEFDNLAKEHDLKVRGLTDVEEDATQ